MRSAAYGGTQIIRGLSEKIAIYFGHHFSPKPLAIHMIQQAKTAGSDEILLASAAETYGATSNLAVDLNIGIYDLPASSIFPVVLAHESTHMFHRQYLQWMGISGHRLRSFSEAFADFFAMRVLGISFSLN